MQYATSGSKSMLPNTQLPSVLFPGDEKYLLGTSWIAGQPPVPGEIQAPNDTNVQFETATVGERSISIALAPRPGGGAPPGLMVQITADGDPGIMEIDVQDAAIDADGAYITPAGPSYQINAWTHSGAVYTAWAEFQPESGAFVSLKIITNPNAVKLKAKVKYV